MDLSSTRRGTFQSFVYHFLALWQRLVQCDTQVECSLGPHHDEDAEFALSKALQQADRALLRSAFYSVVTQRRTDGILCAMKITQKQGALIAHNLPSHRETSAAASDTCAMPLWSRMAAIGAASPDVLATGIRSLPASIVAPRPVCAIGSLPSVSKRRSCVFVSQRSATTQ